MEKTTIGQVAKTSKDITINHVMIVGMYTLDKVDLKVTCYTLTYRSQKNIWHEFSLYFMDKNDMYRCPLTMATK